MRLVPCLVPALVAVMVGAIGCSPAAPEDAAVDSVDGGLPTKDAGLGTEDGGLGTKDDSGLGTKDDSGLGTKDDSGLGTEDAGSGTEDAGGGAQDAGMTGAPDAGEMDECLACAEKRCGGLVNTCLNSQACVEEGTCDLGCLSGSGGPNLHCVESCSKDSQATHALLAAVTCGFGVCPRECLRPLIACGGDAGGLGPVEPTEPGCLGRGGAVPR